MKKLVCGLLILWLLAWPAFAHPGGTDVNGGHTDCSSGEYHYHHGYPEHDHVDGECPYDYDDRTGERSGTGSGTYTSSSGTNATLSTVNRILMIGNTGNDVRALQRRLNSRGYDVGTVDGVFGEKTQRAVKDYQRDHGWPENGVADSRVLSSLFPELVPVATSKPNTKSSIDVATTAAPVQTTTVYPDAAKWTEKDWRLCAAFMVVPVIVLMSKVVAAIRDKIGKLISRIEERKLEKLKRKEHARKVAERCCTINGRIDAAQNPCYSIDYTLGIAYINRHGKDEYYHNLMSCCPGTYRSDVYLVSVCAAKEMGFEHCPKCGYDTQPSRDAFVLINPRTKSRYHRVGSECISSIGLKTIKLDEARAMGLHSCPQCDAPNNNPKVWF